MTALNMDVKKKHKCRSGSFHRELGEKRCTPKLIESGHVTSC